MSQLKIILWQMTQLIEKDNNINDPIIPPANKINVVEHNCNDLGNIETGPMRPILTVSEWTTRAYYELFLKYLSIDLLEYAKYLKLPYIKQYTITLVYFYLTHFFFSITCLDKLVIYCVW